MTRWRERSDDDEEEVSPSCRILYAGGRLASAGVVNLILLNAVQQDHMRDAFTDRGAVCAVAGSIPIVAVTAISAVQAEGCDSLHVHNEYAEMVERSRPELA